MLLMPPLYTLLLINLSSTWMLLNWQLQELQTSLFCAEAMVPRTTAINAIKLRPTASISRILML